jgi:hypothetical protein
LQNHTGCQSTNTPTANTQKASYATAGQDKTEGSKRSNEVRPNKNQEKGELAQDNISIENKPRNKKRTDGSFEQVREGPIAIPTE